MNIRKIIRESLEQAINDQLIKIDGFKFVDKKTDENDNLIWKYSRNIKSGSSNREDSDYIFNLYLAKSKNNNWYYKIFVYWKKHTSQSTSGRGKEFELQFGPFNTLDELKSNLTYNLKHNNLFSPNNYKDNNKLQLDDQIYIMIDKVKDVYDDLNSCDDSYFEDLKKEIPHLFKEKPEVDLYIKKNYPDEDDKQQLLMILNKIDSLKNLKEIENIKSLF
jgi:hypothetical protein